MQSSQEEYNKTNCVQHHLSLKQNRNAVTTMFYVTSQLQMYPWAWKPEAFSFISASIFTGYTTKMQKVSI